MALDLLHPEIEIKLLTDRLDKGSETYRGHDGFLSKVGELMEVFDDLRIQLEEIVDADTRHSPRPA